MAALERPEARNEAFNIGNPREVETTLGLARRAAALVPGTEVRFEQLDRMEVRSRVPLIDKARRLLGFEPQVSLDQGLRSTLAWYRETGAGSR